MLTIKEFLEEVKPLIEDYNNIISNSEQNRTEFQKIAFHEIGNKINSIIGFYQLLKEGSLDAKRFNESYAAKLELQLKRAKRVLPIAKIKEFTKEDLIEDSKLNALEIFQDLAFEEKEYLEKAKININFYGNSGRTNLKPCVAYTLFGTLFDNAIKFATPDSKICIGINSNSESMLLAIENNHNKGQIQRLDIGEGRGLGTKFAIKTISALDGQIQKYSTPKLIAPNERDFYGTQITLPHNQKDLTSKL